VDGNQELMAIGKIHKSDEMVEAPVDILFVALEFLKKLSNLKQVSYGMNYCFNWKQLNPKIYLNITL